MATPEPHKVKVDLNKLRERRASAVAQPEERGGSGGAQGGSRRGSLGGGSAGDPKPIAVDPGMLGFFAGGGEDRAVPLKVVGPRDVELSPDEIIIPPDGGWGWMIVFIAFLSNVFVDGTIFAFALIQAEIINQYILNGRPNDPEMSGVAWAGSLILGFNFLSGPITSTAADRFGFRVVSMAGSFVAGISFVIVGCTGYENGLPRLPIMYVFYGVIAGLATGMIYMPSVVCVGFYFDKKRALAVGLAISGTGCGTFVMALLTQNLIGSVGWQGAICVQGIILFSCSMIGALYRPLEADFYGDDVFKDLTQMSKRMRVAMAALYKRDAAAASANASDTGVKGSTTSVPRGKVLTAEFPLGVSKETGKTASVRNTFRVGADGKLHAQGSGTELRDPGRSVLSYNFPPEGSETARRDEEARDPGGIAVHFDEGKEDVTVIKLPSRNAMNKPTVRPEAYVGGRTAPDDARDGVKYVYTKLGKKKVASGTESELRHRISSKDTGDLSGQDLQGEGQGGEETETEKPSCMKRVIHKLKSFRITAMPTFWLIAINGFLVTLGYPIPYIYLGQLAVEKDVPIELAFSLLSFLGMANTLGRILCGYFSDSPKVNSLYVNNISGIIAGAITIVLPYVVDNVHGGKGFLIFGVYAILYGATMACFATLRSILIRDFIGLSVLAQAFGLCLSFQGVAAVASSPMAVGLHDRTNGYKVPFIVSGILVIAGSALTFLLPAAYKRQQIWDAQKEKEEEEKNLRKNH